MSPLFNQKKYKERRKELRNTMTGAEITLWLRVKNSQLKAHKFRRQQGIGPFIVDFFCSKMKLAIELDGDTHLGKEAAQYDAQRDIYLRRCGVTTIRFTNDEVLEDIEGVLKRIGECLP